MTHQDCHFWNGYSKVITAIRVVGECGERKLIRWTEALQLLTTNSFMLQPRI